MPTNKFLTASGAFGEPIERWAFSIPDGLLYLFMGALQELTQTDNWEEWSEGIATAQEMVDEFLEVLESRMMIFQPISARVRRGSALSIATSTATAIPFTTALFDSGGFWDASVATPTRLTAPVDGVYYVTAHVHWAGATEGFLRQNRIVLSNGVIKAVSSAYPGSGNSISFSFGTLINMTAGQYVELVVFQNSGVSVNVNREADFSPEFSIFRVT